MKQIRLIVWMCAIMGSTSLLHSQYTKPFSLQLSAGPNYYFNNLVLFHDNVKPLNYSAYTQVLWNTQYRLSFGLEAGYIRLYRVGDLGFDPSAGADMTAVPIHMVIKMRIYSHFYGQGSFGPSFLTNNLYSAQLNQKNSAVSIADMSLGVGYRHPINERFYIGGECRFFYSSKSEDRNLALPFFIGLNF